MFRDKVVEDIKKIIDLLVFCDLFYIEFLEAYK